MNKIRKFIKTIIGSPMISQSDTVNILVSPINEKPIQGKRIKIELRFTIPYILGKEASELFDLDYALFVCVANSADPWNYALALAPELDHIVYFRSDHQSFPIGSNKNDQAVVRSMDELYGGNTINADESAYIILSRLPKNIIRIGIYVHLFNGSKNRFSLNGEITQQYFKHLNPKIVILDIHNHEEIFGISLSQQMPDHWGVDLGEFRKRSNNEWFFLSKVQPLDGDSIDSAFPVYGPKK